MANEAEKSGESAAAIEGGSYDVIRRRLLEQGAELAKKAEALNDRRKAIFGGSDLALIANERVRTENNCVPRDIKNVGGNLLFGFNVFIGLRAETTVADVLSLHQFAPTKDGGFDLPAVPVSEVEFLSEPAFLKEFASLYRYNKETRLLSLRRTETRLLAIFQIGATLRDIKVFRWGIDSAGGIAYIDGRGEEDNVPPRAHDFEWTLATRENHVTGRHPHVSILNEVFVDCVGGDLTIKVEDNTEEGRGIYREPVDDGNQALDDAEIHYAKRGSLILLKVKPFREDLVRYLVFNTRRKKVVRIDAMGLCCLTLPEDQGIVFPGGYYLRTGDYKVFDGDTRDLFFKRAIRSPNGEDVLYVFHRPDDGYYLLLPYNLIRKEVATPIHCHGYSLFDDGKMIVFRMLTAEPTRVHPMQVWQTPFTTAEHAASAPTDGSYLGKVGNADLVRGISEALTLRRLADNDDPTRQMYEDLIAASTRMIDAYYWLGHAEALDLKSSVEQIRKTGELIIDEFEKIASIKQRAEQALTAAEAEQQELTRGLRPEDMKTVDAFMGALSALRRQRGALISLRELRFMSLARVDELEADVVAHFETTSRACVEFLLRPESLHPLTGRLAEIVGVIEGVAKASDLLPLTAEIDSVDEGLSLLGEVVGSLAIDDATARTRILEGISEAYSQLNRARATLQAKRRDLSTSEGRAEFGAQFKLFGQSVVSALALCDTPERCDEQLSRLLVQLEELEGKFSELDEFLGDLAQKREEVNDALSARRQTLLDERQRRAQNLQEAADRIATGVARRARTLTSADELNGYFASDAMVLKLRDLAKQLLGLGQTVKADEVESKLKSARQDALRALRDREDLYEEGTSLIKLGRHRFNVQTQPIELSIVPRKVGGEDALALHLAGTDFYEPIEDPLLAASRELWDQQLVSESGDVYRGEYLAISMLHAAEEGRAGLSLDSLSLAAIDPAGLLETVRAFAADRHDEGYERGVHDADAALILEKLLSLRKGAGLLRFDSEARALACLCWASLDESVRPVLHRRARSLGRLHDKLGPSRGQEALSAEIEADVQRVAEAYGLGSRGLSTHVAARVLTLELAAEKPRFTTTEAAAHLCDKLRQSLDLLAARAAFDDDLRGLEKHPRERLSLALSWIDAFLGSHTDGPSMQRYALEAAVMLVTERRVEREISAAVVETTVTGLLGQHSRIAERSMSLRLDEILTRVGAFIRDRAPRFRAFRKAKHAITEREKARLRLDELTPRVLSSFVRNRLIDEVYLPLIGDNLAKQLGAAGDAKRTDLMGLLLLISPPGYGKTTLMEYVANRLGLVFMKVNGPALGHDVRSLDPNDAPNATARQEVDKINLGLEMGNNVMIYLDDIQHTNPELLQKFISLCDAQRRIEGVWRGRTRTYDLRGKKVCVVMAGNPYTESGDKFQIPDMLANRADTYNLGDILEGKDDLFALSYIENALTSNRSLAPLSGRETSDVHKLLRMAKGEDIPVTELAYAYSAAEVAEMVAIFERLFTVQETLLDVNLQYIASASQDDAYRTEPPFKLQGSYRNMAKLAEKVVAAHTDDEIQRLIDDHYASESQTLTTGAEQNLLKLADMRGRLTPEQRTRWEAIKKDFVRTRMMGGKDDDPVARVTGTLTGLGRELEGIRQTLGAAALAAKSRPAPAAPRPDPGLAALRPLLEKIEGALAALAQPQIAVRVERDPAVAELLAQQVATLEQALLPIVRAATEAMSDARASAATAAPPLVAPQTIASSPQAPQAPPVAAAAANVVLPAKLESRLNEITGLLRALEERLAQGVSAGGPARYEAALGMNSVTNFYRGLKPGDITQAGGIFVATYRKLPARGSRVGLRISLPGGVELDATGIVEWLREARALDGADTHPGFGAKLLDVPADARGLIHQYVVAREPMLFDDA